MKTGRAGFLRQTWLAALVAVATLASSGVAAASYMPQVDPTGAAAAASHVPQVDPASVPTGFLAAHNQVSRIPVSVLARAVQHGRADLFIQHVRLDPNAPTSWHTHPGPAIVTVISGTLTYEDAKRGRCRHRTYPAGTGFVDRGFGHVHRAVAGPAGTDFYVVYLLPPGSPTHLTPASTPRACAPAPEKPQPTLRGA
jgi:quercetin dioxygenase-like cupin family protein